MACKPSAAQQAAAEAKREELIEQLADGIDKLTATDEWQKYLKVQASFRQYSFNNTMLILIQRPDATAINSYKRWQEVGRQVNAGEHGIKIFAPSTRKVEVETPSGVEKKDMLTGFRLVSVFDVQQTSGDEIPEPVKLLDGEDCDGLFGKLSTVAESLGFTVSLVPEIEGHPGANGVCRHDSKQIKVASAERSGSQQVKTLSHELGHAILHGTAESRADRATCELEAESTAFVVGHSLGLDTSSYSLGYVASWNGGDAAEVREAIKASGARIHTASKQILDGLELEAERQAERDELDADFELSA